MNFANKNVQQYQVTHKQRDIYRSQSKQEAGPVSLNLYGGKFYQPGERKHNNAWERERGMRGKGKEMTMVLGRVSTQDIVKEIRNFFCGSGGQREEESVEQYEEHFLYSDWISDKPEETSRKTAKSSQKS